MPVARSKAAHGRIRRAVCVLDPVAGILRCTGEIIGGDVCFGTQFSRKVHELVNSEIVRFPLIPHGGVKLRPLVPGTDSSSPIVSIGKASAWIANKWHVQRL